ncbi:valine--pyruvate transaminase [Candidatus Woesearchaeota archaeon]|nr:valine--pyruvate transaminase [Candidatus Woesearchaeota archaeon]
MYLSKVGKKMNKMSGVRAIMTDIIETLAKAKDKHFYNLSAGNPVVLPEVRDLWKRYIRNLLDSDEFDQAFCRYGGSNGYVPFIKAVCSQYNKHYNWNIDVKNVIVGPGSQKIYYYIINAFSGSSENGEMKKVLFPLSPEYTGYSNQAVEYDTMISYRPKIDILGEHEFKYRPHFENIKIDDSIGVVVLSRPTNPTGNVVTDEEIKKIIEMAEQRDVPVVIDNAYAPPIPNICFTEMTPQYGDNVIHCFSLSKAGMPGARIGVAIGNERYIKPMQAFQANSCLHSSMLGQAVAAQAMNSGELEKISNAVIRKFYFDKKALALKTIEENFNPDIPYYVHKAEGTLFIWIWFKDLPITCGELYQKLKQEDTIVVPGDGFFPGLEHDDWKHKQECIRLSMTTSDDDIVEGLKRIGKVVGEVYGK